MAVRSQPGGILDQPSLPVQKVSKKKKDAARMKSQKTQLKSVSGGNPPKKKQGSPEVTKQLKSVGGMRR